MSEIVVVASMKAQPGKEDALRDVLAGLVAPTHDETGCILYSLHQGGDDPRRFAYVERWSSRADLDAHLASPHVATALERTPELLDGELDIAVYNAMPEGETHKGSLAAHAGS